MTTPTNWPNPERPGVPMFPERDGWHAIGLTIKQVKWWDAANKYWWDSERRYYLTLDEVAFRVPEYGYKGPVLTPTQIAEMLAGERERCADVCREMSFDNLYEKSARSCFGRRCRFHPQPRSRAMRTREEQIEDLTSLFGEEGTFTFVDDRDAATKHILEAERRAEQRVRAEIGRDSERLDWLLSQAHYGIPGFDPKVSGRDPTARKADLIRAIDSAREVG